MQYSIVFLFIFGRHKVKCWTAMGTVASISWWQPLVRCQHGTGDFVLMATLKKWLEMPWVYDAWSWCKYSPFMLAQEPHSFLGFNWPLTAMRTSHILALWELKSVLRTACLHRKLKSFRMLSMSGFSISFFLEAFTKKSSNLWSSYFWPEPRQGTPFETIPLPSKVLPF
jgi:hypothetical protein